jgi:hypothetical protein
VDCWVTYGAGQVWHTTALVEPNGNAFARVTLPNVRPTPLPR